MSDIITDRKEALKNTINSASDSIEQQLGSYKEVGKNALIIGGIVLGGYLLSRLFTPNDDETEESLTVHETKEDSFVSSAVKGMATTLILTLVKDKLLDFIEQQINKNEP